MSEIHMIHLDVFLVPLQYLEEVIFCLVNTIVFHRAVGEVDFKEKNLEHLDIDYVICDNLVVQRHIKVKISEFITEVKELIDFKMEIIFFKEQMKDGWITKYKKQVEFEKWIIPIHISKKPIDAETRDKVRLEMQLRIHKIIKETNERIEYIPLLKSSENPLPFLFEIRNGSSVNFLSLEDITKYLL